MFDALDFLEPDPIPETPAHGQPQWCTCTNCREMPTDLERKCCRQRPENCVSQSAYMDLYVLDEGDLRHVLPGMTSLQLMKTKSQV